nr:immunoglobulin light chain junction region [Macaca mulatta]MOW29107.1 immunoglobulin light chain junction region [Macaca mulatta]MOW29165.1 immunoglobulin light chain junction region [Macaca mulatta]MOW30151.1 immunoglobulin light chain junction region [Macaca mulatta]MOW30415.1 immunoglobulin light chain junction region [Macaca mulatta]
DYYCYSADSSNNRVF